MLFFILLNKKGCLKADIEKYFISEKSASFAIVIIGVVAIVLALVFFFYLKTNWYKGVAIPFIIIGLLHVTAGYTVYKSCDEGRKKMFMLTI